MDNGKVFLCSQDVADMLGVSVRSAQKMIQEGNRQLKAKGKYTIRGFISRKYLFSMIEV